jgi:tRNA(Leu) C34 or U34 (ribose-2'-O)-methylase TrmL
MRGFASIGLQSPKDKHNMAGVLRAAHCYGASSVMLSGERMLSSWIKSAANTTQAQKHIPIIRGDLKSMCPYGAVPVAVDLVEGAVELQDFIHPESAYYIFGPEDGTLGKSVLDWCPYRVAIPTAYCMNLAATVNVVLYDRLAKQLRKKRI